MCQKAKKIVIKEIRLHGFNAIPWIFQDPKLKIIHLIRDPRGIYNSLLSRPGGPWPTKNQSIEMCQQLSLDLKILKDLDASRYMAVKFEDIVQNPSEVFTNLNQKLNLQFDTSSLIQSYRNHQSKSQKYFKTYRKKGYDAHHWRKYLKYKTQKRLTEECLEYLELAQYSI